jgi:hypothetical protein
MPSRLGPSQRSAMISEPVRMSIEVLDGAASSPLVCSPEDEQHLLKHLGLATRSEERGEMEERDGLLRSAPFQSGPICIVAWPPSTELGRMRWNDTVLRCVGGNGISEP